MCNNGGDNVDRVSACYDVAGFRLRVGADSPELLGDTTRLLGRFQVEESPLEESPPPAWRLRIGRGELDTTNDQPAGMRQIWTGDVPPDYRGVNYAGPGLRRIEVCRLGRLDMALRTGTASITLSRRAKPTAVGYFLVPLVCQGLMGAGHFPIHAACLAAPIDDRWRSVLIVAQSETGKSTTALALTDAGWKMMGDDIALVCRREGRLMAWGLPRACHVRRNTIKLLPWLGELPLVPISIEDTFTLSLESLGRRRWPSVPRPLEPALVICLDPPNAVEHRIGPLDRASALIHLSHENVQPVEGGTDADARGSFAAFAGLARQTPACRLSVGPRLDRLATLLTEYFST